ncbi:hypothetical protein [Bradyrhizobium septentrionale]|uniref:Uncharacterized protein n=1 Tax=Bradyrhizobium septentrionale TaxID=1404411 RepID=A0A973W0Q0_9BRAD|nr:hypothetical protein [Bradyrhizobium septentrionale]UGY14051.1 hypothetical protein HAP48_0036645 [Bradyrhizobium septentrionale]UGY22606.1 hypothetical protein HU675_0032145 [Bradyrhizobium septentrionale]
MKMPTLEDRPMRYQWASDVAFDGIRMEVFSDDGNVLFDVSVADNCSITISAFGGEVAANVIEASRRASEA